MPERMTEQELKNFLEENLPPVGQSVDYRTWHEQIKASAHPEALMYYSHLKREGKVKPSLTANEDGSVNHQIERVG